MKILGGELTPAGVALARLIIFVLIALVALVTAVLSSFMITESQTKERKWWIFLMVITWVAFAGTGTAAGFSIKVYRDIVKPRVGMINNQANVIQNNVSPGAPLIPQSAPAVPQYTTSIVEQPGGPASYQRFP